LIVMRAGMIAHNYAVPRAANRNGSPLGLTSVGVGTLLGHPGLVHPGL
jgi:hypothetical protein